MLNPRAQERRVKLLPWRLRFRRSIVSVSLPHQSLLVDIRDEGVGKILYLKGEYEPAETLWFMKNLKPGMVVVDVGAHVGYFATLAARLIGPQGRVVAIEPDKKNFELLTRNIKRNNLYNVLALKCAVGEAVGKQTLYRSRTNDGDHRLVPDHTHKAGERVDVSLLDLVLREAGTDTVDVIKIDVQGYELQVLRGALKTINHSNNVRILTEFWPYGLARAGTSAEQFFVWVTQHGFVVHQLLPNGEIEATTGEDLSNKYPLLTLKNQNEFTNLVLVRKE